MMNEREKIIHLWFRNEGCTGGRRYGMAKVIKENLDGFYMEIDIFSFAAYNNSTRQATACVCQSVEVRGCAGRHCLTELSGGVVQ